MEEILKFLLAEVQAIREAVNGIDERLKRIEIADSNRKNTSNAMYETYKNQSLTESSSETPQAVSFELQDIWSKVLEIIKGELNEISFNTWIKTVKPATIENKIVRLVVPSQFNKGILELRYNPLIKKAIEVITGEEYQIEFSVAATDESNNSVERHNSESYQEPRASLNPQYTFDSLVIGEHNKLVYKSVLEIAKNPCKGSRLLYIYAGIGLGKTHILQAIGNYIIMNHPAVKVKYISMDDFISGMIQAIMDDSLQKFKDNLMRNDVLILDNLQNIAGKERTQEEFHRIVRSLLEDGKQVVVGCTKAPQDIFVLNECFTSLFGVDGAYEISKPNLDTRIEILRRKVAEENLQLNDEIIGMIANEVSVNVRELIGALNRITSYGRLTEQQIDTDMVERIQSLFSKKLLF